MDRPLLWPIRAGRGRPAIQEAGLGEADQSLAPGSAARECGAVPRLGPRRATQGSGGGCSIRQRQLRRAPGGAGNPAGGAAGHGGQRALPGGEIRSAAPGAGAGELPRARLPGAPQAPCKAGVAEAAGGQRGGCKAALGTGAEQLHGRRALVTPPEPRCIAHSQPPAQPRRRPSPQGCGREKPSAAIQGGTMRCPLLLLVLLCCRGKCQSPSLPLPRGAAVPAPQPAGAWVPPTAALPSPCAGWGPGDRLWEERGSYSQGCQPRG